MPGGGGCGACGVHSRRRCGKRSARERGELCSSARFSRPTCPRRLPRYCGNHECGAHESHDAVVELIVSEYDGQDESEAQWRRLWAAFEEPRSVLLAHYWNHYALVFATFSR